MKYTNSVIISFATVCCVITGCANSGARYRPIVDGEATATYAADLNACQTLATSREYVNGDVNTEALLGATVGALAGALEDGTDGFFAGAVAGTLVGGADRVWAVRDERKAIVVRCLQNRGHNVVG